MALPAELKSSVLRGSDLLRQRRRGIDTVPVLTAVNGLDQLLGGGLARGTLVELVGRGSCGRFAAVIAALQAVTSTGEVAALVDQGGQLDPQAAVEAGVDLERLLWLRPERLSDSLAAAELLVHTRFPLVSVDLGLPPVRGRAPLAAWLRLARAAQAQGTVVLIASPYRLSGCAATAVVVGSRGRGQWSGVLGSPRLLRGLSAGITLIKHRGHRSDEGALVDFVAADASFWPEPGTLEEHPERMTHHA
jgi:hypothetical protein